ncbi:hypothetical protein TNCV_174871 [Trichonephila clavipes]|nr:hypothetical protein TNCV_174871 [Trichonephila clavipes]
MNSPDYDDFIDMFSAPTPVSSLPPTPVASPSHEASEDVIYDSLPPMEQSTVSETPLKNPLEPSRVSESPFKELVDSKPPIVSKSLDPSVKKAHVKKVNSIIHRSPRSKERWNEEIWNEENVERRNEKRWHEETRPRDPRLYKRPNFRPPYQRHHFKPRVFQRPPYAQQLMPTFQENAQVFFHSQGLAVLCIRNSVFTLTNGVVSRMPWIENVPTNCLNFYIISMSVPFTSPTNILKKTFKDIQASWNSSSPFKRTPVMLLNSNGRELGQCPFCNQTTCHRWIEVQGMCAVLHQPINPIFHS